MSSQTASEYYAAHFKALREYAARTAAGYWPNKALQYTSVNGRRLQPFPEKVRLDSAKAAVRRLGKDHTVHEYDIVARDGVALRIAAVYFAPGFWSDGAEVIDVYEIPAENLA
ncbi:hypothetical protein [Streptomyces wuyuanensis]|uniref:hypothetical protein n=1 Tax=Streptomyces wuyuanensis TaxID=1196353 RepID=UPI0037A3A519